MTKKTKTTKIGDSFVTDETDVVVKMPKSLSSGIKLSYNGLNIQMTPINMASKNKIYYSKINSSFCYEDTYDKHTNIVYTPTFSGVKCDIVLEQYTGRNTFSFEIKTNGYDLVKDNESKTVLVIDDNGNTILTFNSIISFDNNGNSSLGDIEIKKQNGNKFLMTITVDNSFLTDSNTVYPVIIDPTASVTYTKQPTLTYRAVYSGSVAPSGSDMRIGSINYGVGRALYKFDKISAKNIIKAELVQCVRTSSPLLPITGYAYKGTPWNNSTSYSMLDFTCDNSTEMTATYGSNYGTNTRYMKIDVTNFVRSCIFEEHDCSFEKGIWIMNLNGEASPEHTAAESNISITTSNITADPSVATFSPYLNYTYEPYKIMLDAGHATNSNYNTSYHEGNRMWQLHTYLKNRLTRLGYYVGTTRTSSNVDTPVATRGSMAAGYDMFISLHSNADDDPSTNRVVVIYDIYNRNGALTFAERIGAAVRNAMNAGGLNISSFQTWTRPLRYVTGEIYINEEGLRENHYGVLRAAALTDCPLYYIVEHSFHTNSATADWLMSNANLEALANAEAAAIDEYMLSMTPHIEGDN